MKIIAHRANLYGPNPKLENNPDTILSVLEKGFDCEIDVWYVNTGTSSWWLGHDAPEWPTTLEFLQTKGLWLHCKNMEALDYLVKNKIPVEFFWHQTDDVTLTRSNYLWTYPGKKLYGSFSIAVMPELGSKDHPESYSIENLYKQYGICTDYPIEYAIKFDEIK